MQGDQAPTRASQLPLFRHLRSLHPRGLAGGCNGEISSELGSAIGLQCNAQHSKGVPEDATKAHSIDAAEPGDATGKEASVASADTPKVDEVAPQPANSIDPKQTLESDAPLWCPVTLRAHSILLDFRMITCPACHQYLYLKKAKKATDVATEPEDKSESSDNVEAEKVLVTNTVDFRDIEDDCVERAPWPGTFDLLEARKDMVDDNLAFEVVTVLETSITGEPGQTRVRSRPQGPARGTARAPFRSSTTPASEILSDSKLEIAVRQTTIIIHSRALLRLIKSVVSYYPSVSLDGKTVDLAEPFALIAHHLSQLENFVADSVDPSGLPEPKTRAAEKKDLANRQLGSLLRFVKQPKYTSPIEEEMARNGRGYCTFRMLWYLFRPGGTVYLSRDGKLDALVISDVTIDVKILRPEAKSLKPYDISLWYLDFDGRHVGRSEESVSIPAFEGERLITSLKLFPVEYRDNSDGGETKRELEELGKRWFGYLLGAQSHYKGEFIGPLGRQFDGRVFVDNAAYIEEESATNPPRQPAKPRGGPMPGPPRPNMPGPPPMATDSEADKSSHREIPVVGDVDDLGEGLSVCSCDDCLGKRVHPPPGFQWAAYDLIDPRVTKTLELPGSSHGKDHRYLLCSRRLFGFVFKSRRWEVLDVKFCSPARIQPEALKSLVMPEERKTIIKALVEQYNTARSKDGSPQRKQWGADYIESKGEGQIFLLHGGPGWESLCEFSSHSYATAECIAEFTGRPLLSLTVGDIGTFEEKVEERLSYWFNLAEKWGAVMLIDEADVYLERRTVSDLRRNGIVSVFLRCMEYYRGILFLTTNRVGQFDDAFVSRIHLIIHYSPLGEPERRKIWTQFFEKLEDERDDISITSRARKYVLHDPEINDVKWNGREIRNGKKLTLQF
ncbi:P-loop containing nucleoside triphosphate hydrolase [Apiospora hydei]|uniref:P-loop containing nucleoside triphosphate hydrolase n=1 Tax=Apiospora hydei TaxID=1337664 RepID=A0ABR1VJ95_9PEZI